MIIDQTWKEKHFSAHLFPFFPYQATLGWKHKKADHRSKRIKQPDLKRGEKQTRYAKAAFLGGFCVWLDKSNMRSRASSKIWKRYSAALLATTRLAERFYWAGKNIHRTHEFILTYLFFALVEKSSEFELPWGSPPAPATAGHPSSAAAAASACPQSEPARRSRCPAGTTPTLPVSASFTDGY